MYLLLFKHTTTVTTYEICCVLKARQVKIQTVSLIYIYNTYLSPLFDLF